MDQRIVAALLVLALGCRPNEPAINLKTWNVAAIGDQTTPVGNGGRYLTMYFGPATGMVSGFAGCNQYNAAYVLIGDSLVISAVRSTMMACTGGMELESRFLTTIPRLTHWQVSDSTLTLDGAGGVAVKLRTGEH